MSTIGIRITQALFRNRINCATNRMLADLSDVDKKIQQEVERALNRFANNKEECFLLGQTEWDYPVLIPMSELITHSLIVGTTGAGKSYVSLLFLNRTLSNIASHHYLSMGIMDAKGELAAKAIEYIQAHAYKMSDKERTALREYYRFR